MSKVSLDPGSRLSTAVTVKVPGPALVSAGPVIVLVQPEMDDETDA
jgi:hypothetical protein